MATSASPAPRNIDFVRSMVFLKDDADWVRKLLIGSLVMLAAFFLVGVPFLIGYCQRTVKRTAEGAAVPLPDWDDWGGLFREGLKIYGVMLVHVLVLLVPMMCCMGGLFGVMGAAQNAGENVGGALGALGALGAVVVYGVLFLLAVAMSVYLPSAQARVALGGTFKDAFQTKANLAFIRRNGMNYALTLAVMLVTNLLSQFGIFLLCIGVLPATLWSLLAYSWALGETIRHDSQFASTGTI